MTQSTLRKDLGTSSGRAGKWATTFFVALILFASGKFLNFSATCQAKEKKVNGNVEIHSDQIELLDVQAGAERCPDQKKATTIRLKVKSEKALDVKIFAYISGTSWVGKDFMNKHQGDEISTYLCDPRAKFKVYAHEAGSNQPWPKP